MVKQLIYLIFAFIVAASSGGSWQSAQAAAHTCAIPTMACCAGSTHPCCETQSTGGSERSASCACGQPEPQALGYSVFKLTPELLNVVVAALISLSGLAFTASIRSRRYFEIDRWRPPKIPLFIFHRVLKI